MWQKPQFTKRQINEAGRIIINPDATYDDFMYALGVIDNWRIAHAFPMNTFAVNLKRQVLDIEGALVVQRLKRLDTICGKLMRYPDMELFRMQDLGGCRVILPTIADVYRVKERLENSRMRHEPKKPKDYIQDPNPNTGYRGVHLIYKYKSDRNSDYNGLLVELQIRTKLQHLWATAVETVGLFTGNGLKFNQGSDRWLEFFKLASAMFSMEEGTPVVEGAPQNAYALVDRILDLDKELGAIDKMHTIGVVAEKMGHVDKKTQDGYYLLELDMEAMQISVTVFEGSEQGLDTANAAYSRAEKTKTKEQDIVLVAAQSYEALVKAYPNYFANISEFINTLLFVMQKNIDRARKEAEEKAFANI